MPTADRNAWAAQAIRYFRRQTHTVRQLVIVDDGDVALRASLGAELDSPDIVYLRETVRRSIGTKRNIAAAAAAGEVLVHWDDDDWYGSDRLATQVAPITGGAATVTALRDAVWFDVDSWQFRRPDRDLHRQLFVEDVHGGTLAYHRSVWQGGARYPDASLAEDAWFLRDALRRGARLTAICADGLYLYVRHDANSWRLASDHATHGCWDEIGEPDDLGVDRPFYAARTTSPPAPPTVAARPIEASCIMPTANRRPFLPAAISSFQAQRGVSAELIILDDGEDPVADLVPADRRIHYLRLERRRTLGEKRNVAVDAAVGEVIVHLDDDDWSHPDRVRIQCDALGAGSAELCGLDRMLWFEPTTGRAWRYTCPPVRRPWVAGNTLAYLRRTWERSPFPAHASGEDTAFVWGRRDRRVLPLGDERIVIGRLHESNTSTKHTSGGPWTPVPMSVVHDVIAAADRRSADG
jgi:glycosyltransferase involved in cell wall biosynthesis